MKWKRVKGTKLVKDKVDGQLKPIMAPNITSTNASSEIDDSQIISKEKCSCSLILSDHMYVYAQPIQSIHSSVGTVGGALGCGDLYSRCPFIYFPLCTIWLRVHWWNVVSDKINEHENFSLEIIYKGWPLTFTCINITISYCFNLDYIIFKMVCLVWVT
jgi:hypothetical protein